MSQDVEFLQRDPETRLAVRQRAGAGPGDGPGAGPGLVWFSGFGATMEGNKARALDEWAQAKGRALTRFDYSGTGQSGGSWDRATIGQWRTDALDVLDEITTGPQILVGSSLGGWIALLAALARPDRVKALVLVAPAADLTETLIWDALPQHAREALMLDGRWTLPGSGGEKTEITRTMIEEGRNWLLLDEPIKIDCPVRILQGWQDREVPWSHAVRLMESLNASDVRLELLKSGDHRLTQAGDLERLFSLIEDVS